MLKHKALLALSLTFLTSTILIGCGGANVSKPAEEMPKVAATAQTITPAAAPEKLHQEPVPIKIERDGNQVNVEMTAQITNIEIDKNLMYNAWTFNGEAPGPLVVVNEGDMINFTLKNIDPKIPHSMDFHAVHAAPSKKFANVQPNETGTFSYPANSPGVFMYHCGTAPVLSHIANGMHGTIIVKPKDGYPTDSEIDREFVMIQNEWYKENDLNDFMNGEPSQVVFSVKSLEADGRNSNGDTFTLKEAPLLAKVGDRIRIYINNVGPNEVSSFHVVGTILDNVYVDGHPANLMKGLQTVMLPASGGAVVEFTVTEEGSYPIVTHQFNHATKGAVAILKVTKDGLDDGKATMSH